MSKSGTCFKVTSVFDITLLQLFLCSHVTLIPEAAEDMWHAYNLVAVGDRLTSTTIRYIKPSFNILTCNDHWFLAGILCITLGGCERYYI